MIKWKHQLKDKFRHTCQRRLEISNVRVRSIWVQAAAQRDRPVLKVPMAYSSVEETYIQELRTRGSPFSTVDPQGAHNLAVEKESK